MSSGIFDFWLFIARHHWRGALFRLFCQPSLWKKSPALLMLGVQSSGALHDIGNTTMVIRFLHAEIAHKLSNRQNRELTAHLENLGNQVLEAQRLLFPATLETRSFSVCEALSEATELFKNHPLASDCKLNVKVQDDFYVNGSAPVLIQALMNILQNSAQALLKQDHKEIVITLAKNKNLGLLTIRDNGPGFPKNFRLKLFTTTKRGGSGIGLWHSFVQLRRHILCTAELKNHPDGGAQTNLYFWKLQ